MVWMVLRYNKGVRTIVHDASVYAREVQFIVYVVAVYAGVWE